MNNICEICEESVASGVMCDDGVYRCIGCAMEDGFDIQTGLPVEIGRLTPLAPDAELDNGGATAINVLV